jgi:uncharacterized protein (TIGR02996 family)
MNPAERSLRDVLEETLFDNPDDLASHAAYADHLTEQGDPRGEFIQLQLALEDFSRTPEQRRELAEREEAVFQKHGREWLGGLAPYLLDQKGVDQYRKQRGETNKFRFARGWLDTLQFTRVNVDLARSLVSSSQTRMLRVLAIEEIAYEEGEYTVAADLPAGLTSPGANVLLRSPFLGNVRVLQWGEMAEDESQFNCHMDGETVVELVRRMPRLEELYLLAHHVGVEQLFRLDLPQLRVLQLYHQREHPLEILAGNASLGRLTHLLLHPHALEPGDERAYLGLPAVRAVVASPHLRSLSHLRLRLCDMGDEGCEEIVRSGILKRLKVLDLMHGRVSDRGALVLAACPDVENLELLDLTDNRLTATGIAALHARGIQVLSGDQYDGDGEEYLYNGDIE